MKTFEDPVKNILAEEIKSHIFELIVILVLLTEID
jgi:hypothetical protein